MEFMRLLSGKSHDIRNSQSPTIAFLGDSVTQGCFELYITEQGNIETIFDARSGYHHILEDIFCEIYPNVPINYIYAGISGDSAQGGLARLERDVLRHNPDLTIVSYGLNDCTMGENGLEAYTKSLSEIFTQLQASGSEVIFMTENMMNTSVNKNEMRESIAAIAASTMHCQNSGILDMYFDAAKRVAASHGVKVCDVYAKWKALYQSGADINHLLANGINHPTRFMHQLFAYSLLDVLCGDNA